MDIDEMIETEKKVLRALQKSVESHMGPEMPKEQGDCVYSNFGHEFELTEEEVKTSGKYHQHAAWDFCGFVWFDPEKQLFVELIDVYRRPVDCLYAETLEGVIREANKRYGDR